MINRNKINKFILVLLMLIATISVCSFGARAQEYPGSNITSNNLHDHVYSTCGKVTNSYIVINSDGSFSRLENYGDVFLLETYDSNFNLRVQGTLGFALTTFGGFYESDTSYFFVFGQDNYDQKSDVDVIRIVQYDKEWKRIREFNIRDCNTTVPFYNCNTSFCQNGELIYIRCGHQSYLDSKGQYHQGIMTISINQNTGEVCHVQSSINGYSYGSPENVGITYIAARDNILSMVDVGLVNPYGAVISTYSNEASNYNFESSCKSVHGLGQYAELHQTIYFPVSSNSASGNNANGNNANGNNTAGNNTTGNNNTNNNNTNNTANNNNRTNNNNNNSASNNTVSFNTGTPQFTIGDYKVSTQYYMVVGNTEPFDTTSAGKNIVVMAVPRNQLEDDAVALTFLTGYSKEDGISATTPYIVEVESGTKYCVLWEARQGYSDMQKVFYTYINGSGERLTDIGSIDGCLSDCHPVKYNGKIIWYTTDGASVKLYSINISDTVVNNNVVYNTNGAVFNGVDYSKVYDYGFYCSRYPDIRVLFSNNEAGALAHFVTTGMREGRQGCANFNVNAYMSNYGDLREKFGDDKPAYYYHFMTAGYNEGRNARSGQ